MAVSQAKAVRVQSPLYSSGAPNLFFSVMLDLFSMESSRRATPAIPTTLSTSATNDVLVWTIRIRRITCVVRMIAKVAYAIINSRTSTSKGLKGGPTSIPNSNFDLTEHKAGDFTRTVI